MLVSSTSALHWARGDYLLLVNDDIEPITPDWIERMLQHFEKPHVGIVGAKLLFPSMKIQHAGVVLIHAKPDHVRFKYPRDDDGYYFSTCAVRNFSAVTGAIMMTTRVFVQAAGGLYRGSSNQLQRCGLLSKGQARWLRDCL